MASSALALIVQTRIPEYQSFPHLRLLSCGGSSFSRTLVEKTKKLFSASEFFISYGMTECCGKISMSLCSEYAKEKFGIGSLQSTSGRAFSQIEMTTHNGEICIRGPTVFNGYWNRDNSDTLSTYGWFHTGDIGLIQDDNGYLVINGRKKDMILRNSENVYPAEVESIILEHENVLECCVFGIPSRNAHEGEELHCAVIFKDEHDKNKLELDLKKYANERLASYKCPSYYHVTLDLPRTGTGKIQSQNVPEFLGLLNRPGVRMEKPETKEVRGDEDILKRDPDISLSSMPLYITQSFIAIEDDMKKSDTYLRFQVSYATQQKSAFAKQCEMLLDDIIQVDDSDAPVLYIANSDCAYENLRGALELIQAVRIKSIFICFVSFSVYSSTNNDIDIHRSIIPGGGLLGFVRSLASEKLQWRCGYLDVDDQIQSSECAKAILRTGKIFETQEGIISGGIFKKFVVQKY